MTKIALIPIDNRPICYDLIQDVLALDNDIELFMPKIEYLGGLQTSANIEKIFEFLSDLNEIDYSQITFMEAFFLGVTTATNTGLVTFDFSLLKPTSQYIVMVASELCGVYFASTLLPSFFRYSRLKKLIKEKDIKKYLK